MKHELSKFLVVFLVAVPAILAVNCNKSDENNPVTPNLPTLHAPTNLRAYSASQTSVGLLWDLSSSESDTAFLNYAVTVTNPAGSLVTAKSVAKGSVSTEVTGLTEGIIYTFVVRAAGTSGIRSADSASIQWSPAKRLTTDDVNGPPIQVYEFASTLGASGLQFYSTSAGAALTQSLVSGNPDRVLSDVYLASNQDGSISLNDISLVLSSSKSTHLSTVTRDATDLDDPQLVPPDASTYTLLTYTIPSGTVSASKILYAKSITDNRYVRILIQKNQGTNRLFSGTSPDRYLTIQLSYQDSTGNMYCRPLSWPSNELR